MAAVDIQSIPAPRERTPLEQVADANRATELRKHALAEAIRASEPSTPNATNDGTLIKRAREFEKYISGVGNAKLD